MTRTIRARIEALERAVGVVRDDADRRPPRDVDELVDLFCDAVAKAEAEAAAGEPSDWASGILVLRDYLRTLTNK